MNAFVFLGPSISIGEAQRYSSAVFLPPVSVGDLAWVIQQKPIVIGIIDGYFYSHPSVWHKEILIVLSEGIHVIGGGGIGALRALELEKFGMVGVGQVFQRFKDEHIEADDEIAFEFASSKLDYRRLSEPMLNIRMTFTAALEEGIINNNDHKYLINLAKNLHYKERNFDNILDMAVQDRLSPNVGRSLHHYLISKKIDILKKDAVKVLKTVEKVKETEERFKPSFELSMTPYVEDIQDVHKKEEIHDLQPVMIEDLTNHARLEWGDYYETKTRAVENLILLIFADQNGITLEETDMIAGKRIFLEYLGIEEKDIPSWAKKNNIALHEFDNYIHDWLLLEKVKSTAGDIDNRTILWQLRLENRYSKLFKETKEMLKNEALDQDEEIEKYFTTRELLDYYRETLGFSSLQDVLIEANKLGFSSEASFLLSILRSALHNKSHKSR